MSNTTRLNFFMSGWSKKHARTRRHVWHHDDEIPSSQEFDNSTLIVIRRSIVVISEDANEENRFVLAGTNSIPRKGDIFFFARTPHGAQLCFYFSLILFQSFEHKLELINIHRSVFLRFHLYGAWWSSILGILFYHLCFGPLLTSFCFWCRPSCPVMRQHEQETFLFL